MLQALRQGFNMNKKGISGAIIVFIILIILIIAGIGVYLYLNSFSSSKTPVAESGQNKTLIYISTYDGDTHIIENVIVARNYLSDADQSTASYKIIDNFTTINGRLERKYANGEYTFFSYNDDCYLDKTTVIITNAAENYEIALRCQKKSKVSMSVNDALVSGTNQLTLQINQSLGRVYFPEICFKWSENVIYAKLDHGQEEKILDYDNCFTDLGEWEVSDNLIRNITINYKTAAFIQDSDKIEITLMDKDRNIKDIETFDIYKFKEFDAEKNDLGIVNSVITVKSTNR
jgi:hypothetical protein